MTLKIKHRLSLPSAHSIGPTLFFLFFICLILMAGYLYFTDRPAVLKNELAASAPSQSSLGLTFIHPIHGYSLDLPFWWRDRYQVSERGNGTNFYYLPMQAATGLPIRLFSIVVLGKNYKDLNGEKIGEQADQSFWLEKAGEADGLSNEDKKAWQKMIDDIPVIGGSFKMVLNDQETALREFVAGELKLNGTTTLPILSYETLATQETSSSTKVFLWLATSPYSWRGSDLIKKDKIDMPAVALWQKDGQSGYALQKIIIPRSGSYYQSDLKKLFPISVIQNPIFKDKTPEHNGMLQKLTDELDASTSAYFGSSPILTKYGWLRKFREDNGNLVVAVGEVSLEKLPVSTTTKTAAGRLAACSPTAVLCRYDDYLVRIKDKTLYSYVVATSTAITVNLATSSNARSVPISLAEFSDSFRATSTSPAKNRIYRLGLVDDVVQKIDQVQ